MKAGKRKMKPNYAKQQNALFAKMQSESLKVMFAVDAPDPSLVVLKRRYSAATEFVELAAKLQKSIYMHIVDRGGWK